MLKPLTSCKLLDGLVYNSLARTACADDPRIRWLDSPQEVIGRAGWNLLTARLLHGDIEYLEFEALLEKSDAEILSAHRRKQESMNRCLVEIACRVPELTQECPDLGSLGRFVITPVPQGWTSSYAPDWIAAVLKRKK